MNNKEGLSLLLVEDDPDTCKKFQDYINLTPSIKLVDFTNSSYRAIKVMRNIVPDVIILDLELNEGNGNGLLFLQDLKQIPLSFKPYILVTTNNSSSTTHDAARRLGADFIMTKHQPDYSEKYVVDFILMMKDVIKGHHPNAPKVKDNAQPPEPPLSLLHKLIAAELNVVGISPKAIGYNYLTDAIILIINGQSQNICTTLSYKYKKTASSIERAMQNAINRAWKSTDVDELLIHYKARINSERGVPTLTEFVHYYAKTVKNQL